MADVAALKEALRALFCDPRAIAISVMLCRSTLMVRLHQILRHQCASISVLRYLHKQRAHDANARFDIMLRTPARHIMSRAVAIANSILSGHPPRRHRRAMLLIRA